jgi:MoxR-like ATPase
MTRSPRASTVTETTLGALDLILDAAVHTRIPVLIWGPPGVGKSAAVHAWAARSRLRC